jgi:hypothetical protein
VNANWSRPHWQPDGGTPFVFLVLYGVTDVAQPVHAVSYRTAGVPDGIDAGVFDRVENDEYLKGFEEGYPWEQLVARDRDLSQRILASPGAIVFAGEPDESETLMYLRDIIGMTAWILDHGAIAVYEPFTFRWWDAAAWKENFFAPDRPNPNRHAMIYHSTEEDGVWMHTRGMLTFGRPDLSIRGIPAAHFDDAADACSKLIEYQALGGILREGQVVRHPALGPLIVHHEGDRDDPDFNNSHVELMREGA